MAEYEVILGTFVGDPDKAVAYQKHLHGSRDQLAIVDAIAIVNREGQKPEIIHDGQGTGKMAAEGAVVGGILGLFLGPAGVVLGGAAGAAAGGAISALKNARMPRDLIETAEKGLPDNASAVLVVMENDLANAVVNDLQDAGAEVIHNPVHGEHLELHHGPASSGYSEM